MDSNHAFVTQDRLCAHLGPQQAVRLVSTAIANIGNCPRKRYRLVSNFTYPHNQDHTITAPGRSFPPTPVTVLLSLHTVIL
nr:MAG TPA: hypothetical protein [Caudoviricetes sp.]